MPQEDWSTYEMFRDSQAYWLVRTYEKTVSGMREFGIPSEDEGSLNIEIPTLKQQADAFRYRPQPAPGKGIPNGVIKFIPDGTSKYSIT